MMDDGTSSSPRSRSGGLVIREVEGETLIYNMHRNTAHCLNGIAGSIWKRCDGTNSVESIRSSIQRETALPVSEEMVWKALAELEREGLLEDVIHRPPSHMSRREMVARVGVAAALPIIASIAVPTGALAASARTCGQPCTSNDQCAGCSKQYGGNNTCHNGICCVASGTCIGTSSQCTVCCNTTCNPKSSCSSNLQCA
jgi:hypothetical protein